MVQSAQRLLAMSGSVLLAMDRAEAGCSGSVSADTHGAQRSAKRVRRAAHKCDEAAHPRPDCRREIEGHGTWTSR
jgi:hypothetical protein